MRTGKLDQRVTLQTLTESRNEYGELIKTYADADTVWADVISRKGDESFEASRMQSNKQIKIKMRYRSDVTTEYKIKWMDQSYNVIDVDRSLRRDGELWLMCESVIAT